mmetsp:Transcript_10502/g.18939  ORF Transcript_10502/g.18939 Transcript_10502/m.18939 type:complete len:89 (-) Transcript_10502:187-453(-)
MDNISSCTSIEHFCEVTNLSDRMQNVSEYEQAYAQYTHALYMIGLQHQSVEVVATGKRKCENNQELEVKSARYRYSQNGVQHQAMQID